MGSVRTILIILAASVATIGCSRVGFQSMPKQTCSNSVTSADTSCAVQGLNLSYSFSFKTGQVDILFVDDNSGSMWQIQSHIAAAFNGFLSQISSLDYQIAITTMDVSSTINDVTGLPEQPKQANGNGAFQDGKFLEFTDTSGNQSGAYVLTPSTPNAQNLFAGTIQRPETLYCQQNGFQDAYCPSDVTRGIYAVNDAIANNQNKFFRPGTHLAIVMVADSDECEDGVSAANCGSDYMKDEPQTLVQNMTSTFPTKSFSVHSIVVPNQQCATQDTHEYTYNGTTIWTWGIVGNTLMSLASPDSSLTSLGNIVPGAVGNVCASDYTSQLSNIGSIVANNSQRSPIQLACNPLNLSISTSPVLPASQLTYNIDSQNRITFGSLPNGITVNVSYQCPMY